MPLVWGFDHRCHGKKARRTVKRIPTNAVGQSAQIVGQTILQAGDNPIDERL
jgi:hypothetical protein